MSGVEIDVSSNAASTNKELVALNKTLTDLVSSLNKTDSKNSFINLNRNIGEATKTVANFGDTSKRAFEGSAGSAEGFGKAVSGIAVNIKRMVTAFVAFQGSSAFIKAGDSATTFATTISLATKNLEEFYRVQSKVIEISKLTHASTAETAKLYTELNRALSGTGISENRIVNVIKTIQEAAKLSGQPVESVNAALFQFRQGLASGVLRGAELNSVMEQTGYLAVTLAKGLGISYGALRKAGEEGQLTSTAIVSSLEKMSKAVERDWSKVVITVETASDLLGAALTRMFGEINNSLGVSNAVARRLMTFTDIISAAAIEIPNRLNVLQIAFKNLVRNLIGLDLGSLSLVSTVKILFNLDERVSKDSFLAEVSKFQASLKHALLPASISKYELSFDVLTSLSSSNNAIDKALAISASLTEAFSVTFVLLKNAIKSIKGPVETFVEKESKVINRFMTNVSTAIAIGVNSVSHELNRFRDIFSFMAEYADDAVSSFGTLFKAKNLTEFIDTLRSISELRSFEKISTVGKFTAEVSNKFREAQREIRNFGIAIGILDSPLFTYSSVRFKRIAEDLLIVGRGFKYAYDQILSPKIHNTIAPILYGIEIKLNRVLRAITKNFNFESGQHLAEALISGIRSVIAKLMESSIDVSRLFNFKMTPEFFKAFTSLSYFLVGFFTEVADSIKSILISGVTSAVEIIISFLKDAFKAVSDVVVRIKIDNSLTDLLPDFSKLGDSLTKTFKQIASTSKGPLDTVANNISKFAKFVKTTFFEIYDEVVGNSTWPDMIDGVVEYTNNIFKAESPLTKFGVAVLQFFGGLADSIKAIDFPVADVIQNFVKSFEKMDFRELGRTLILRMSAAVGAGFMVAAGGNWAIAGALYFVSVFENMMTGSMTVLLPKISGYISATLLQISKEIANGIVKAIDLGFGVVDVFVDQLLADVLPFGKIVNDLIRSLNHFGNNLYMGLLLSLGTVALLSKTFREFVKDFLFGSKAINGAAATEGLFNIFNPRPGGTNAPTRFDKLFDDKRFAAASAAIMSTSLLTSVSVASAAFTATPLLLVGMLGKDGGVKAAKKVWGFGATLALNFVNSVGSYLASTGVVGGWLSGLFSSLSAVPASFPKTVKLFDKFIEGLENFRKNGAAYRDGLMSFREAFAQRVTGGTGFIPGPSTTQFLGIRQAAREALGEFINPATQASITALWLTVKTSAIATFTAIRAAAIAAFSSLATLIAGALGGIWSTLASLMSSIGHFLWTYRIVIGAGLLMMFSSLTLAAGTASTAIAALPGSVVGATGAFLGLGSALMGVVYSLRMINAFRGKINTDNMRKMLRAQQTDASNALAAQPTRKSDDWTKLWQEQKKQRDRLNEQIARTSLGGLTAVKAVLTADFDRLRQGVAGIATALGKLGQAAKSGDFRSLGALIREVVSAGFSAGIRLGVLSSSGTFQMLKNTLKGIAGTVGSILGGLFGAQLIMGFVGLQLFGPGTTLFEKLEWVHDKMREIFNLKPATQTGRFLELERTLRSLGAGKETLNLEPQLRRVDFSQLSEGQYKGLESAVADVKNSFDALNKLYQQQGKFTEANIKEYKSLQNTLIKLIANQPQLSDLQLYGKDRKRLDEAILPDNSPLGRLGRRFGQSRLSALEIERKESTKESSLFSNLWNGLKELIEILAYTTGATLVAGGAVKGFVLILKGVSLAVPPLAAAVATLVAKLTIANPFVMVLVGAITLLYTSWDRIAGILPGVTQYLADLYEVASKFTQRKVEGISKFMTDTVPEGLANIVFGSKGTASLEDKIAASEYSIAANFLNTNSQNLTPQQADILSTALDRLRTAYIDRETLQKEGVTPGLMRAVLNESEAGPSQLQEFQELFNKQFKNLPTPEIRSEDAVISLTEKLKALSILTDTVGGENGIRQIIKDLEIQQAGYRAQLAAPEQLGSAKADIERALELSNRELQTAIANRDTLIANKKEIQQAIEFELKSAIDTRDPFQLTRDVINEGPHQAQQVLRDVLEASRRSVADNSQIAKLTSDFNDLKTNIEKITNSKLTIQAFSSNEQREELLRLAHRYEANEPGLLSKDISVRQQAAINKDAIVKAVQEALEGYKPPEQSTDALSQLLNVDKKLIMRLQLENPLLVKGLVDDANTLQEVLRNLKLPEELRSKDFNAELGAQLESKLQLTIPVETSLDAINLNLKKIGAKELEPVVYKELSAEQKKQLATSIANAREEMITFNSKAQFGLLTLEQLNAGYQRLAGILRTLDFNTASYKLSIADQILSTQGVNPAFTFMQSAGLQTPTVQQLAVNAPLAMGLTIQKDTLALQATNPAGVDVGENARKQASIEKQLSELTAKPKKEKKAAANKRTLSEFLQGFISPEDLTSATAEAFDAVKKFGSKAYDLEEAFKKLDIGASKAQFDKIMKEKMQAMRNLFEATLPYIHATGEKISSALSNLGVTKESYAFISQDELKAFLEVDTIIQRLNHDLKDPDKVGQFREINKELLSANKKAEKLNEQLATRKTGVELLSETTGVPKEVLDLLDDSALSQMFAKISQARAAVKTRDELRLNTQTSLPSALEMPRVSVGDTPVMPRISGGKNGARGVTSQTPQTIEANIAHGIKESSEIFEKTLQNLRNELERTDAAGFKEKVEGFGTTIEALGSVIEGETSQALTDFIVEMTNLEDQFKKNKLSAKEYSQARFGEINKRVAKMTDPVAQVTLLSKDLGMSLDEAALKISDELFMKSAKATLEGFQEQSIKIQSMPFGPAKVAATKLFEAGKEAFAFQLEDASRNVYSEMLNAGRSFRDSVMNGFKEGISSLMKGDTSFSEFGKAMLDKITSSSIDSMTEGLTNNLANKVGPLLDWIGSGQYGIGHAAGDLFMGDNSVMSGFGNPFGNAGDTEPGFFSSLLSSLTATPETKFDGAVDKFALAVNNLLLGTVDGKVYGRGSEIGAWQDRSLNFSNFGFKSKSELDNTFMSGLNSWGTELPTGSSFENPYKEPFSDLSFIDNGFVSPLTQRDPFGLNSYDVLDTSLKSDAPRLDINTPSPTFFDDISEGFSNIFSDVGDAGTDLFSKDGVLSKGFDSLFGKDGMLGGLFDKDGMLGSLFGGGTGGGLGGLFQGVMSMFSGGGGGGGDSVGTALSMLSKVLGIFGGGGGGGFATGGLVTGTGTSTSDSIPARLSNGEFVIRASQTKKHRDLLTAINNGTISKYADGGLVGGTPREYTEKPFEALIPNLEPLAQRGEATTVNINITGDVSKQTKREIYGMLPQIAQGVNMYNKENRIRV